MIYPLWCCPSALVDEMLWRVRGRASATMMLCGSVVKTGRAVGNPRASDQNGGENVDAKQGGMSALDLLHLNPARLVLVLRIDDDRITRAARSRSTDRSARASGVRFVAIGAYAASTTMGQHESPHSLRASVHRRFVCFAPGGGVICATTGRSGCRQR